ncbi:MAG: 50S ribosomal protein L21 [Gemmataceae bacterium]|nr:50S ribosomal protein L21 [Gemmataceae bacterium]
MYAIFEDGSRQYKVSEGTEVVVDFRAGDPGTAVAFDRVLLFAGNGAVKIGQPTVSGAKIAAEVVAQTSIKTRVQHFRRRKNSKRLVGHRQPFTRVKITKITAG